jgi:DNA polymerase
MAASRQAAPAQDPGAARGRACRQWLEREIAAVKPHVIVALAPPRAFGDQQGLQGYDDARAVRGESLAPCVFATLHPSALLRLKGRGGEERRF